MPATKSTKTIEQTKAKTKEARSPKLSGKSYTSVSEMIRDTCDPDFADEFDAHLDGRRLIKSLTLARIKAEMTQTALASGMGCGQAKVSKMERSMDADVSFGDISAYAKALGLSPFIAFLPEAATQADRIRFHADAIKEELAEEGE
jgi:hypothetical protein